MRIFAFKRDGRDDVSLLTAGKKEVVTKNKKRKQKDF